MELRQNEKNPLVSDHWCYAEKDRTGVLSGKWFVNPGFNLVKPLLPLLGDVQAPAEDEDERIAKDSDLMEAVTEKDKAKEEKSAALFHGFQSDIYGAAELVRMAEIQAAMKASKRYLSEQHIVALRQLYEHRRNEIVKQSAPDAA
jgi:hypothetical protein